MKNINKCVDLTDKRFNRLVAKEIIPTNTRKTYWLCECDCGNLKKVRSDSLQGGQIQSCGCLKREQDKSNLTKHYRHMESKTRLYYEWQGMKSRCYDKNSKNYHRWGGRGIVVCDEWINNFEAFRDWALSNGYAENLTLDREDNNGNYEPSNCRWATHIEQCNNRRSNIVIEYNGESYTLIQICRKLNLNYSMVHQRYKNGISGDDLFKPSGALIKVRRGTENNNVKINDEVARNIKNDIMNPGANCIKIAEKYNISKYIVYDIKRGKTWAWI